MFRHYHAASISTPVHSVTLGLPCRSLWPQLWAHLVQSRLNYTNSVTYGMSASNMNKLQSAQNFLTHVVLPSLRHLLASERLTSTYCSLPNTVQIATLTYRPWQPPTTPAITSSPFFNPATTQSQGRIN